MKLVNFFKIKLSLLLLTIINISHIDSLKLNNYNSPMSVPSNATSTTNTTTTNGTHSNSTTERVNLLDKDKLTNAIFGAEYGLNSTSMFSAKNSHVNSHRNDTGICKIDGIQNTTNAVGVVGNNSYVDKYPYTLKRCDQVIMLKAKMVHPTDCMKSVNVFITLSAYYVNVFSHKNSERLLESVNTKEFDGLPDIMKQSPECIIFYPKKYDKLRLCFGKPSLARIIYDDYLKLFACSKGFGIDGVDCLDNVDFSIKGALGRFGPKLKNDFLKAKFEFVKKLTGKEPHIDFGDKQKVNPYYSSKKVPGS